AAKKRCKRSVPLCLAAVGARSRATGVAGLSTANRAICPGNAASAQWAEHKKERRDAQTRIARERAPTAARRHQGSRSSFLSNIGLAILVEIPRTASV